LPAADVQAHSGTNTRPIALAGALNDDYLLGVRADVGGGRQQMVEVTAVVAMASQRLRIAQQRLLARTVVHVLQVYTTAIIIAATTLVSRSVT